MQQFTREVAGRKIHNKLLLSYGSLKWVYRIYAGRPWQLRKILQGVHGVYELEGEVEVRRVKKVVVPMAVVTAEARVSRVKVVKVREVGGNRLMSDAGILLDDKSVDPPRGAYQIDAEKERDWRRRKEMRDHR